MVQPKRGVAIEGMTEAALTVPAGGATLPVRFQVRAVDLGVAELRIIAFHKGQPLGSLTLTPSVVVAGPGVSSAAVESRQGLAPISVRLPDLSMLIEQSTEGGTTSYVIRLTSPHPGNALNYKRYGPVRLNLSPEAFFRDFFAEIEQLPTATANDRAAVQRALAAKGTNLFEALFPDDLRARLWELRDSIQSVVVQSDEQWIPWELCKLVGTDRGRHVEGPFLCEAFTVSRWETGRPFLDRFTLSNIAIVVPDDSGLPMAVAERDHLLGLATPTRRVTQVGARAVDVHAAFSAGEYDGWHFSGHGAAGAALADHAVIELEGGEAFRADSVTGSARNVGLTKPLVFFNACQVGRGGVALTGIGGWGHRFLDAGAGAFIGTYWSVTDRPAYRFATALYDRLLAGAPIASAVKEARAAIRSADDPTWLAYTLLADPLATVGPRPSEASAGPG